MGIYIDSRIFIDIIISLEFSFIQLAKFRKINHENAQVLQQRGVASLARCLVLVLKFSAHKGSSEQMNTE